MRDMTDDEAYEVMVTENLQRKDVDPFEESAAFLSLSRRGYDVETLCGKFGKSRTYISSRLKLNDLIPEFRDKYEVGEVDFSHCLVIARLDKEFQRSLLARYGCGGYYELSHSTVEELRRAIRDSGARLSTARFDTTLCKSCAKNTACGSVFLDPEAICEDKACFNRNTAAWAAEQFETVRRRNPDFFIIEEKNTTHLNDVEKVLFLELKRRGFRFVSDINDNQYASASIKHRYDVSDESITGFSFGWKGFLCARQAESESATKKWINDFSLNRMACGYEQEIRERQSEYIRDRILALSDEELKEMHFPNLLDAVLVYLVSECYDEDIAFGELKGKMAIADVCDVMEQGFSDTVPAIARFLAGAGVEWDTGLKYLLKDFHNIEEGTLEKATEMFYDDCRACFHGYGYLSNEEIDEELNARRQ